MLLPQSEWVIGLFLWIVFQEGVGIANIQAHRCFCVGILEGYKDMNARGTHSKKIPSLLSSLEATNRPTTNIIINVNRESERQ